jgi:hypothetical protein
MNMGTFPPTYITPTEKKNGTKFDDIFLFDGGATITTITTIFG